MSAPNIVLIGMRASGKTTLGRELARRLERPFLDLDDALAQHVDQDADAYLARAGEAAFRAAERVVLERAAALRGHVIATGGGAVLHDQVFGRLADGAHVFYLEQSAAELVRRARARPRAPLTDGPLETEVAQLLREREPLYRGLSDWTVPADAADPILVVLEQISGPVDER